MSLDQSVGAKMDGRLLEQLGANQSSSEPLEAWFVLKPSELPSAAPAKEATTSLANSLVEHVQKNVGERAQSFKVLANLNSFMVSAPPAFVRDLVKQPEIASARLTSAPGLGLIAPVKSVPVKIRAVRAKRAPAPRRRLK